MSSMNTNTSTKNQQKSRRVDEIRTSNCPNGTKKRKDPAHNGLQAFTDRNEAMRGAEGPNKVPRSTKERTKGWHDKRMRKKEYNM